ncbi:glycosyltransferase family 1 protein [Thermothielavioides terrestris NRRL 8126]|uniref:Glycosyltransferase family 1 protein n=1 Tax=Thermothielavioides terrestris (strain ATCC 38088 / NRRL 8126) TaxID=578455 RepID=G2R113_THETT|nr:glycosyltransferase family 1 protein [Thermothielavioides terrestris NRRL 8126]AEO66510.1 glycosyltransferase family 1 protein [Thermothielavioides terrestris NRRL 8126]
MGSTTPPKRVLLLTNSEHGQANVFLATSYALLTLEDEDVEVHFASFPPIRSFVSSTSEYAQHTKPGARPIVFHTIEGVDMVSAWTRPEIEAEQAALKHRSCIALINAIRRTLVLLKVTLPWTGPEFVQIFHSVTDIIQEVQADIIAVDPAFSPALTAIRSLNARFIVLSPNTIKDFAMPLQPNGDALWKYPWYIEFPLRVVPTHVVPCGPILRPARPVAEVDPALAEWLRGHPGSGEGGGGGGGGGGSRPAAVAAPAVVYINMGTHVFFDEVMAGEMARAVRVLLDRAMEKGVVQSGVRDSVVERVLGEEVRRGVVRIVEWMEAEPTAVLESGAVVCAVHHGGANSFLESVSAGVPQVVLPMWMDTYDFARRAELLGIGRWGNRRANKLCEGSELGEVLADVVVSERSVAYAQRAKELADLCKKLGGGRVIAARHILSEIKTTSAIRPLLPSEGENESDPLLKDRTGESR